MKIFKWRIQDVHFDCALYACLAWVIFSQTFLGGDDAEKYIYDWLQFWLNYFFGSLGAIVGAVKMFRSDTFSRYRNTDATKNNSPTPVP